MHACAGSDASKAGKFPSNFVELADLPDLPDPNGMQPMLSGASAARSNISALFVNDFCCAF